MSRPAVVESQRDLEHHTQNRPNGAADADAWWRLWALAAAAHVIARGTNEFALRGIDSSIVNLTLGMVALLVIVRPDHRTGRTALVVGVPLSMWLEAPLTGNHWVVAALVSVAALAGRPWTDGWEQRAFPGIRSTFLVFYSFAAFSKLNTGFFSSADSCARVLGNQLFRQFQLPEMAADSPALPWLAGLVVLIEMSVPLLLLTRRTRALGVTVASLFHLSLSADLIQHFYDFTLVLLPLFWSFAGPGGLQRFDDAWTRWSFIRTRVLFGAATGLVVASALPLSETLLVLYVLISWLLWIGIGVAMLVAIIRTRPAVSTVSLRPTRAVALPVLVALAFGAAPYLGLGPSHGFDMYSNLYASPASNHLVLPTLPTLRDGLDHPAVIIDSSDELLASYIDEDLALAESTLVDYLARHTGVNASYRVDDHVVVVDSTTDRSSLPRISSVERKFFAYRPLPADGSSRCQFRRRDLS